MIKQDFQGALRPKMIQIVPQKGQENGFFLMEAILWLCKKIRTLLTNLSWLPNEASDGSVTLTKVPLTFDFKGTLTLGISSYDFILVLKMSSLNFYKNIHQRLLSSKIAKCFNARLHRIAKSKIFIERVILLEVIWRLERGQVTIFTNKVRLKNGGHVSFGVWINP